jgi:membrane protein DedA with SNARE-associated domain
VTAATTLLAGSGQLGAPPTVRDVTRPDGPLAWVWLFFFCVVVLRAQATYWIARVVTTQALSHTRPRSGRRARVHAWLSGDSARGGIDRLQRWGAPAVTLSFLTIGAQTAVNAAAGVLRMPFRRYLLAMLPGCAAWATVWSTIGMSAFYAALAAGLTAWWGVAVAVLALAAVATGLAVRRSRKRSG